MSRGVVMFAHNGTTDYYSMACYTAARVNQFLDLPVTIISDAETLSTANTLPYSFDNTIVIEADRSNMRKKSAWINKGRYQVYNLSPYDETLVIDTDLMINSRQLLTTFELPSDFVCHRNTKFIMEDQPQEMLSRHSVQSLWATVMRFKRSSRVEQIFNMIEMVQNNYTHYSSIHKFQHSMYRNDYALTIALRTVNGHIERPEDYLHWRLLHVGLGTKIHRIDDTQYLVIRDSKPKAQYIIIKDTDFHMLSKDNFMELTA